MFVSEKKLRLMTLWLFAAGIALYTQAAHGQKVSKILPDKGWVLVSLKDTSSVTNGQSACFLDSAGTSIACGKVVKIAKTVVVVKADPASAAAQVKPGFKAEFSDGAEETAAAAPAKKGSTGKKPVKTAASKKKAGQNRIRVFSGIGTGVASISKVGYKAPALAASGVKLWESQSKPLNIEKFSVGAEFETAKAGTFGFRYAMMGDSKPEFASKLVLETDYDVANRQKYVSSEHEHTVMGIYYDYAFLQPAPAKSGVRMYGGLDLVNSTAKMTGNLINEADSSEREIATIDSSLTVASLRTGIEMMLRFGQSFEMGLGLRLAIPLAAMGLKQETTLDDDNSGKSEDEQNDLKVAIDHKKNSFGAVIPLSMSIAF